ncbi:MAG: cupin [Chloroflexi bacterium]|nr:MAG: cupin [Chloroflexota bacterium]
MVKFEHKDFANPDEVREFPYGRLELLNAGDGAVGRLVLEPGWRWSEHVKPIAGTEWCEAPHFQYHVSGVLRVIMDDGTEFDAKPGEFTSLPARHDAYVVGDEQCVIVDFFGALHYAEG